jgi:hypothetical protein
VQRLGINKLTNSIAFASVKNGKIERNWEDKESI